MKLRLILLSVALGACAHSGRVRVDTPIAPYQKPDISEITGIDDDDEAAALDANAKSNAPAAAPAPAPAPAPAEKK
jgi:hypothetical protein